MIVPVIFNEEDSTEIRSFHNYFSKEENKEHEYAGCMIYGSEEFIGPARYQEFVDFFKETKEDKLRMIHC